MSPDQCRVDRLVSARNFMLILAAVVAGACTQSGPAPSAPVITAQGFDIADARVAPVSAFGDVRLRLEVSGKIDSIGVTERAFSSDLARTLDTNLFRLFGLDQRPYSRSDVTLNLRKYINERITEAGVYQIEIIVTDYLGQSSSQRIAIDARDAADVEADEPREIAETWAEIGDFVFRRVGRGDVSGADPFGITWKTVDPIRVTIRLAGAADGATKIARIDASDFREARTRAEVEEIVDRCVEDEMIEVDTARAAAAGEVFAVVNDEQRFLLEAFASETTLTDAGTTVVVAGRYKR